MIKKQAPQIEQLTVDVTSAFELKPAQQKAIAQLLEKRLGVRTVSLNLRIDPHILSGFQIQIGSSFIDASVKNRLNMLQKLLQTLPLSGLDEATFVTLIKRLITQEEMQVKVAQIGRVVSVKDGVVRVSSMRHTKAGELIDFAGVLGIVFNLNQDYSDVVLLGPSDKIKEGDVARQTGNVVEVPVGKSLLGRVVNALGQPIDGNGDLKKVVYKPIEAPSPGIVDRQTVSTPFQTGIKVIDALVPIGLGQRELIVGDRQTGKTSLIVDSIIAQARQNERAPTDKDKVYSIYVAIGQKMSTVADVVRTLENAGAMENTIVVSASASDAASLQYIAPFAGCTMGEYFRDHGMHAVVFYDDLSKHANAYRQISLLLRRPPGREAYPGDIFYLHARLLERASMMSMEKGGGSLTAIPVVETQEGDVSAYIPTNIISITDGQIFLEGSLFHEGIRPAVNVGLSVSRVGSKAQRPLLAKLASSLKLDLAQYRELLSFAQIASDLDISSQDLLQNGVRMTEILKQPLHEPFTFAQEFVSLYAATNGYLRSLEVAQVGLFEKGLQEYMALEYPEVLDRLSKVSKMDIALENKLKAALKSFAQAFAENRTVAP